MNRIFILLLSIIFLIIGVGSLNSTSQSIFGPPYDEIKDIEITELEPDECISYDEYSKEDYLNQQKYIGIWSTIWQKNLNKLDIITRSSSSLKGYPFKNLFDKKINTAWVPEIKGIKGNGIDQWISIELTAENNSEDTVFTINQFGIISGYLKSDKTWEENNRVKTALLIIKTPMSPDIYYAVCRLNLKDFKGVQVFKIPRDLVRTSDPFLTKTVWLIIEDVYPGSKYSDTCISEIVIRGTCLP